MATQENISDPKPHASRRQQAHFSVQPGSKVQITIDVGETIVEGKVSLVVQIEEVIAEPFEDLRSTQPQRESIRARFAVVPVGALKERLTAVQERLRVFDLATWLFFFALAAYLLTRLIGLTQFPIYFFTDEAIQTQSIIDLVRDGYKDPSGVLLPTYFRNGDYYNLSLSVYLQWLPYMLLGKSALVTRATSVLITVLAAISIGILLRDIFKLKYWWTGTMFLSITPAWFLHSRTAFETVEFVAFYAGMLCAYLFYRYKTARYLYLTVFLAALSFYTYSPAQMIVPLTALGLLLSDWRYHWENRRTLMKGLLLAVVVALPYVRYSMDNPSVPFAHLHTLWSYWFEDLPLTEKLTRYFSEFGVGLSPWYWYIPNERDLPRHLMKDYGHIMLATLPFALLGMTHILRTLNSPASRVILIALLVSPAAAALVQVTITRALVFVVPAAILTSIGLEKVLDWIEDPRQRLARLAADPGPTPKRLIVAAAIFLIGLWMASIASQGINRIVILCVAVILAVPASGIVEHLARSVNKTEFVTKIRWRLSQTALALLVFLILVASNISMLSDALRNGPLWFRDYGMGGMQYGAFQIFDIVKQYLKERPETKIVFSPDWANGTDVVARFFLGDPSPIQIASVRGHIVQKLPLDEHTMFVITPQEYDAIVNETAKIKEVRVEQIVPYPDGNPGFYFVRLTYADGIDEIFAAERAERQVLQEAVVTIDGQDVSVRFSFLDSSVQAESIALLFDDDPFTLAKTYENNPFFIELTFPESRVLRGFSINIGGANARITVKCYPAPEAEPIVYTFEGQGTKDLPELSFDFPAPTETQMLQVEVLDPFAGDPAKIHIWELKLR
ncbi:MAG TPA: glycosyltransferase family 39 protein [Anaerolineales bacterium]|nr:glycosyltransferase family 39 protein [Anaerolineales bacterium]